MRWLIAAVTVLMLAGCGSGVEWLPENSSGTSASPNGFTFNQNTVTQAVASSGAFSQSNIVTVQGTDASGWTVTVADATTGASSQFSANNGTFTSTPGTILPNQNLQIQHKASTTIGGQAITTVKVGGYITTFVTTTVANP